MTEESSTTSHLSVAMTTDDVDEAQTATGNTMTSSSSGDAQFYFRCAVVIMGVVGTAGNALVLYALIAAKQHKKNPLIVNQNALDLFGSFFLVVSYATKLANIRYIGALGYWLCITLHSELFVTYGMYGSRFNIAAVTVERYLKVVHHVWSKNKLRPWMINSAMAFCWLVGIVIATPVMLRSSGVRDVVCYYFECMSKGMQLAVTIWYFMSFYVIIFAIFIFCYGRILVAIRRQARVVAAHSAAGSSTSQTHQSNQIQTNVIKTMILVSAFYVICHLPQAVLYSNAIVSSNLRVHYSTYYLSRIIQFLYVTANPFIYALKFDPVKKVLKGMMPSRVTVWFNHCGVQCNSSTVTVTTDRGNQELANTSVRE